MESNITLALSWLVAFAVAWIAARGILAVLKSEASDTIKASWIALIICLPIFGAVLFWLFSGASVLPQGTPEEREALLKAQLNRNER